MIFPYIRKCIKRTFYTALRPRYISPLIKLSLIFYCFPLFFFPRSISCNVLALILNRVSIKHFQLRTYFIHRSELGYWEEKSDAYDIKKKKKLKPERSKPSRWVCILFFNGSWWKGFEILSVICKQVRDLDFGIGRLLSHDPGELSMEFRYKFWRSRFLSDFDLCEAKDSLDLWINLNPLYLLCEARCSCYQSLATISSGWLVMNV